MVSVGKTTQVTRQLKGLNLVTEEPKGKVRLYRYNLDDAAARYLKIFFDLLGATRISRGLTGSADKVVLFGNAAEGTDTAESDIDLLIVTGDKRRTEASLRRSAEKTSKRISPVIVDQQEFDRPRDSDPAFYEQVARGIVLWQRED